MQIDMGLILGGVAAAGATWRAYKGYQGHLKKRNYEPFSWLECLKTVLPALAAGFVTGAMIDVIPDLTSADGIIFILMLFTGGAGVGSLAGKLPFKKPKV